MTSSPTSKLFLRALAGERTERPPIWLMRQAGRYLPEYREIRATVPTFMDFCYSPRLATEATLQPIRRFGFDAAILFSDILVIPDALGQRVTFEQGEGPRLPPIEDEAGLNALHDELEFGRLAPVFEAIDRIKGALPAETALIGFCGAPWTVASYMIAGRGTPDQAPARSFAYRHPDLFARLIGLLVRSSVDYLERQILAGVEAVQIFDSWAGVLPDGEFEAWSLEPILAMARELKRRQPQARIIAFPRGVDSRLAAFADEPSIDALGLDTATDGGWAARHIQPRKTVQGNLDPLALIAGGAALDRAVERIRATFAGGPHIFNLGHGILPPTPIAHVERMLKLARG